MKHSENLVGEFLRYGSVHLEERERKGVLKLIAFQLE